MDATGRTAETDNGYRNLEILLDNVLQEIDACSGYAFEAQAEGDHRLAGVFEEAQSMHAGIAERIKAMLDAEDAGSRPAGVRTSPIPLQGDPADLSSGQDVAEPEPGHASFVRKTV